MAGREDKKRGGGGEEEEERKMSKGKERDKGIEGARNREQRKRRRKEIEP